MADDQDANEGGDEGGLDDYEGNDGNDLIESTTTAPQTIIEDGGEGGNLLPDDYSDDGPLPDVTVQLIIDVGPEGALSDIVTTTITDQLGNVVTRTPLADSIDQYTAAITQGIYEQLNGNGRDIQEKRWWSPWTWHKALIVGLIALCIIGIILALLFFLLGKRFGKNKQSRGNPPGSTSGTTKSVVSKGISPMSEYSTVPTSV